MTSMQIKSLIRNIAKEKNIDAQILLRNYMLERFLERVSYSKYNDNFILKGGMLIASMVGIDTRSTMDLDATIKNIALTEEKLIKTIDDIISIHIDDDIKIKLLGVSTIRDEADYNGFRLSLEGSVDKTRIPLKVDITTGDVITPVEIKYSFKLLLENRTIEVWAYNLETVLAEKLESIISRSTENTRMRDFYDVHILNKLEIHNINNLLLQQALKSTSFNRHSFHVLSTANNILDKISTSKEMNKLWNDYSRKNTYASNITWQEITCSLKNVMDLVSPDLFNNVQFEKKTKLLKKQVKENGIDF